MEVTYIANERFLISSSGRKIMIDAGFKAETDWCVTPSDSTAAGPTGLPGVHSHSIRPWI